MKALVLTFGAVIVAAGLVVSCMQPTSAAKRPGGTDGSDEEILPPTVQSPRLASLAIQCDSADYFLGDINGNRIAFNSETFSYTVRLTPGEVSPQIKLVAIPVSPYIVNYNGKQEFVPQSGDVVIIAAVAQSTGLSQNYVIAFSAGDLQPARLSSIQLTAGSVPNFVKTTTSYEVTLPYVQNGSVAAIVSGEFPNSTFTFYPGQSITLVNTGSGATLSGAMEITVSAPGYDSTKYTFLFNMPEPSPSELLGITLSSGVLTDSGSGTVPFAAQPAQGVFQYITLPAGTTNFVITAEKKLGATVDFNSASLLGGTSLSDDCSASFTGGPFAAPNNEFTITVNDGPGFSDTVYGFKILHSESSAAQLTGLAATGSGVSLYQREQNSTNGNEGFLPEHLLYNVSFETIGSIATLTASAEAGAVVKINDVVTNTLSTVTHASGPIQVSVEKAGQLTTVYTVYPKLENPETAQLTALMVAGGTLTDALNQPITFAPGVYEYNVRVLLNAMSNPVLMVTGTAGAGFAVSYPGTHGNYISSVTAAASGSTIIVRVEGGAGYEPGVYTLTIHPVEPKNPRLTSLSVNNTALADFSETTLHYNKTLNSSTTNVSVSWTKNDDVAEVSYSTNSGTNWSDPVTGNSVSNIVTLGNGESKTVYIKVCADDSAENTYSISLSKPLVFLEGLLVNGSYIPVAPVMSPDYFSINSPQGGFTVTAGASGATFSWTGASPSTGNTVTVPALTAGQQQYVSVTVTVSGQTSSYTLILYKPLAYYFNANAAGGGNGETANSAFNSFEYTVERAKETGINIVEVVGGITAVNSFGGSAESLFSFNGYGTADNPLIIRNFHFSNGSNGKRIISIESSSGRNNYIVFENPRIQGANTAYSGAGMNIVSSSGSTARVTLKATVPVPQDGALVYQNHSNGNGGGIAIYGSNSSLVIQDETGNPQDLIRNNTAANGGGLFISGATVEISGKISHNNATASGGGVYLASLGSFQLNGYITDNVATNMGGGIYVTDLGVFELKGYVKDNSTGGYGGGICMDGDTRGSLNGHVKDNNARVDGGGIYMQGNQEQLAILSVDFLSGSNQITNVISTNTSLNGTGGGIYLHYADLSFNAAATVSNNIANTSTSGLHIESDSTVNFTAPVQFENNVNERSADSYQIYKIMNSNNIIYNVSNIDYPSTGYIYRGPPSGNSLAGEELQLIMNSN